MLRTDRYVGSFLALLAVYVCYEGLRLGLGSVRSPGTGFVPFWVGVILGLMALILIVRSFLGEPRENDKLSNGLSVLLIILALFGFITILEYLGFILSTFFFLIFVLKIVEHKRWFFCLGLALPAALGSYVVFEVLLEAQLPRGFFGF